MRHYLVEALRVTSAAHEAVGVAFVARQDQFEATFRDWCAGLGVDVDDARTAHAIAVGVLLATDTARAVVAALDHGVCADVSSVLLLSTWARIGHLAPDPESGL